MYTFILIVLMWALIALRIHPNLKSTVYCYAIAFGGLKEWDFAWSMFKNATVASEAARLRAAMACTQEPWLLNRYPCVIHLSIKSNQNSHSHVFFYADIWSTALTHLWSENRMLPLLFSTLHGILWECLLPGILSEQDGDIFLNSKPTFHISPARLTLF